MVTVTGLVAGYGDPVEIASENASGAAAALEYQEAFKVLFAPVARAIRAAEGKPGHDTPHGGYDGRGGTEPHKPSGPDLN